MDDTCLEIRVLKEERPGPDATVDIPLENTVLIEEIPGPRLMLENPRRITVDNVLTEGFTERLLIALGIIVERLEIPGR
jgi:hypothetical protein